jgi:hypothetical protein
MSDWPSVENDLRRALLASGKPCPVVDRILADLAPVFAVVERTRGAVDSELVWALVCVAADRARRRAQHERSRAVVSAR